MKSAFGIAASLALALTTALPADGDEVAWHHVQSFDEETQGAFFSYSVDICGDLAIVGEPDLHTGPHAATPGQNQVRGSAYIFGLDDIFAFDQIFPDGAPDDEADRFGESVGISGGNVIVGAPRDNRNSPTSSGVIHFFCKDESTGDWNRIQTEIAPDDAVVAFGFAVALDQRTAFVGREKDLASAEPNRVYVYDTRQCFACFDALTQILGTPSGGDVGSLAMSDNDAYEGQSGFGFMSGEPQVFQYRVELSVRDGEHLYRVPHGHFGWDRCFRNAKLDHKPL